MLNMFAGAPVTDVAVTVIGKAFVPVLSMVPGAVAVGVSVAAEVGKAPSIKSMRVNEKTEKALTA